VRYLVIGYENTTKTGGTAEGEEGTKGQPICIAVLSADPVVPEDVPGDSPKSHVDDPNNEGAGERQAGKGGRGRLFQASI